MLLLNINFSSRLCSLFGRQRWGSFKEAHLWKPGFLVPGTWGVFPCGRHQGSPVTRATRESTFVAYQFHTEDSGDTQEDHTPLSLSPHIFPLERCRPHLTPSVLVFFFIIFHAVFSLSLFLWEQHSPFYQYLSSFSPLCSCETVTTHLPIAFSPFVWSCFICYSLFCCTESSV